MNDRARPAPRPRQGSFVGRCRAVAGIAGAHWQALLASRRERRALIRLGEAVAAAPPAADDSERVRRALEEVAAFDAALARLGSAAHDSLEVDRRDWAASSAWARPAVVARGLLTRGVLRDQRWRTRRSRREAYRRLGATALEASLALDGAAAAPAQAARGARDEIAAASSRGAQLLEPLGGALFPAPAHHVGREAATFGKVLLRELRGHLVPRVPAVAGLIVGWLVTSTFTDSQFSATLHSLGIGSGPRHAVTTETYDALKFWLPLLAAALCSYASARLAALVRARYAPVKPDVAAAEPEDAPRR